MKATFELERETKRAIRFAETGEPEAHKVGTLYVKKTALKELTGNEEAPSKVTIELKVVK